MAGMDACVVVVTLAVHPIFGEDMGMLVCGWCGCKGPYVMSDLSSKVAIVANPYSGRELNQQSVDALATALAHRGLEAKLIWDSASRQRLIEDVQSSGSYRCLVSAGGDGTLADLINGLHQRGVLSDVLLAVLPLGNENLFARQFGFTRQADQLAVAIERGIARQVDVGCASDRLFATMVSAGLDADVVHRLDQWRVEQRGLKRVGRLNYLPQITRSLRHYTFPNLRVEVNGQEICGAHVFVFNLPQYGMNLDIWPPACVTDGLLDWVVFRRGGRWRTVSYAWSVLRQRHLHRADVLYGRTDHLRIHFDGPVPVQTDGDPAGSGPVEISACPKALNVLVV